VSARIHCPVQIRQASVALFQSVCTLHFPSASLLQLHSCLPFRSTVSFFSFILTRINWIETKECTYPLSNIYFYIFVGQGLFTISSIFFYYLWIFSDDLKAIVSAVSNGDVSYLYGLSPTEFLLIAQNYLSGSFQLTEVTYFTLLLFIWVKAKSWEQLWLQIEPDAPSLLKQFKQNFVHICFPLKSELFQVSVKIPYEKYAY